MDLAQMKIANEEEEEGQGKLCREYR